KPLQIGLVVNGTSDLLLQKRNHLLQRHTGTLHGQTVRVSHREHGTARRNKVGIKRIEAALADWPKRRCSWSRWRRHGPARLRWTSTRRVARRRLVRGGFKLRSIFSNDQVVDGLFPRFHVSLQLESLFEHRL